MSYVVEEINVFTEAEAVYIDHSYDRYGKDISKETYSRIMGYFRFDDDLYYSDALIQKDLVGDIPFVTNFVNLRLYELAEKAYDERSSNN